MALTKEQLSEAIALLTGSPELRKQLRDQLDNADAADKKPAGDAKPAGDKYEFLPEHLRAAAADHDQQISAQSPPPPAGAITRSGALPENLAKLGDELQAQIDSGRYLRM